VRLAWLVTGSQAAAEDVVQDAMTGVYRSFERLESPSAYLRSAVVNGAKSRWRSERRQQERVALLERERVGVDVDDAGLFELIGGLPYRQRVVIVARYWCGWSEAEIARALGCRRGTVKSLASRALSRLGALAFWISGAARARGKACRHLRTARRADRVRPQSRRRVRSQPASRGLKGLAPCRPRRRVRDGGRHKKAHIGLAEGL
jgi:RNA polymerase sigma factor (sigma-70 family)